MTEEKNKILTEEEIYDQYTKMQKDTIPKILNILQEEQYNVAIVCNGLISITRALINTYGTDDLRDECIHYLSEQNFDQIDKM